MGISSLELSGGLKCGQGLVLLGGGCPVPLDSMSGRLLCSSTKIGFVCNVGCTIENILTLVDVT